MSNFEKFDLRDGTHIRFTKTGKGEPLVLLHTIRNRLEYFDLVIPYLKDNYTVYAIDLPGFGDSPVNKNTNYDQSFMTDVVIDFIEQNDLSNVTLAGESISGVLPLTVANKISRKD
jgi:Predicted hydrolases or acyltransferases (alpha/beta hydrolase superfamily)